MPSQQSFQTQSEWQAVAVGEIPVTFATFLSNGEIEAHAGGCQEDGEADELERMCEAELCALAHERAILKSAHTYL
jgi:hypothetical protein